MSPENDHRMEVDETVHDFVYRVICQGKHLWCEDISPLRHPHHRHLFDILIQVLGVLDKIGVVTLDRAHKIHHLHDTLLSQ